MEETIIIPSPNWFHVSIMSTSLDGWLVYGGPSKSLCFLEPLTADCIGTIDRKQRFKAHVLHRAHKEKIVSVDISPEWPEKRNVLTASIEGVVKEWNLELKDNSWSINYLHCQEEHNIQKEECAAACYGTPTISVSVGIFGNICKWDLNTNVVKRYYTHLKNFKPTCISCSPHKALHVAVGTRQGVIFVIDITGPVGKLIYKIRAQDDEINRVSWCPQFTVTVNKTPGKEKKQKEPFSASSRMERIRNNQESSVALETALTDKNEAVEDANNSQVEDEVIIPEDDMFDVYKDHDTSEFGHKKYEPEDIYVKVKEETNDDFLTECEKLKADILRKKNEPEPSIQSLVEALDKAHVKENADEDASQDISTQESHGSTEATKESADKPNKNEYKHLLASIGKYGGIKIWTQSGVNLASCTVLFHFKKDYKDHKNRGPFWPTIHWHTPDCLLITDGKNQLLKSNPLKIDSKDKIEWQVVHSMHRRGLYYVGSNAPRVQTTELLSSPAPDEWTVWTIGQDRNVISYNLKEDKPIETYASCGAYIYDVKPCAYDAGKVAMTAGDGSIRVWSTHATSELEDRLASGVVTSYWQNVQGKILTVAWHPTKENLLAFATAESRVGILDTSGACEKPAKNFPNAFRQGVYSVSWGEGMDLYACGGATLAVFRANKINEHAKEIPVNIEGQVWEISSVLWTADGVAVGSCSGGLALLDPADHRVIAATFVFSKMIYTIAWHPKQTTSSEEVSQYQNYIAVCSVEKTNTIAILEYDDKDGAKQFKKLEPLSGHEGTVLHVAWNPHRDAQLLSTSQDYTVRIWSVVGGECVAIFGGHCSVALSAVWCALPRLADRVLSGGGDCCLRLWDYNDYPAHAFAGVKKEAPKKKKPYKAREERLKEKQEAAACKNNAAPTDSLEKTEQLDELAAEPSAQDLANVATSVESKVNVSRSFLLPVTTRHINKESMKSIRMILLKYVEENNTINMADVIKLSALSKRFSFLKMFGTTNEVNELLDYEAHNHIELENFESYSILLFFRGNVSDMIQFASANDLLDPYLLSLCPTVSNKFWKDTMQLFTTQLKRTSAKADEKIVHKTYGGASYNSITSLLAVHDVRGCIDMLMEYLLFKEAYILCRIRHIDSIADEVLFKWATNLSHSGALMMSSLLHLVRGDVSEASSVLGRSNNFKNLQLAASLAKLAGHNAFATHIEEKVKERKTIPDTVLKRLPSRIEALLDANDSDSEQDVDDDTVADLNGRGDDVNGDKGDSHEVNGDTAKVNGRGDGDASA